MAIQQKLANFGHNFMAMFNDSDYTDYGGYAKKPYYITAFESDLRKKWRGTQFELSNSEIYNLCYYRALSCFFYKNANAINDRRLLLYTYLKKEFKTNEESDNLNRYRDTLPVYSIFDRMLRNVCTAYNEAPVREFGDGAFNDYMNGLYSDGQLNLAMQDAYKLAKLSGFCAIRPVFINGTLKLYYLAPSEFRITTDPVNSLMPISITYIDFDNTIGENVFIIWTNQTVQKFNQNNELIFEDVNTYGRIPFIFLKLDSDKNFYSAGMFGEVEEQLVINKFRYLANLDCTFNGMPIKVATNLDTAGLSLAPDKIVNVNDVKQGEGMGMPPSLEFITPDPQYHNINDFSKERENTLYRSLGFPSSMIDSTNGNLTGIARIIEKSELLESRLSDLVYLRFFEKELAKLITLVSNIDNSTNYNLDFDFNVDYAEERVYIEPNIEYEFDKVKVMDGVSDPIEFIKKWSGIDRNLSDAEAIEIVKKRKEILKQLEFEKPAVIQDAVSTDVKQETQEQTPNVNNSLNKEVAINGTK